MFCRLNDPIFYHRAVSEPGMIKIGAGCKPNSVPAYAGHDHLTQDAGHPAPRATYPEASDGQPASASLFGLAPGGVYPAFCVATKAVSSYLTISPLPVPACRRAIGGVFSVALSCSYLQFALRTTVPCGVRTFLSGACPERSCARPKYFILFQVVPEPLSSGQFNHLRLGHQSPGWQVDRPVGFLPVAHG